MLKPEIRYLIASVVTGNLLTFATGAMVSWASPVLATLTKPGNDNPLSEPVTASQFSWIGSCVLLGSIFGPGIVSFSSAKLGRKWTMVWLAFPLFIALIILAFAEDVILYYVGRFIGGISVGGAVAVVPIYLAEITDKSRRGATGASMKMFGVMGIFYAYVIGPYLSIMWFSLALTLPLIAFLAVFPFYMPESPYFLISVGKEEAAKEVLKQLRGGSLDLDELQEIKDVVTANAEGSFKEIFHNKLAFKGLLIITSLLLMQQLGGVNVVVGFTESILDYANSSLSSEIAAMVVGASQVLGGIIAPIFVDKHGRKVFLIASAAGMLTADIVLGVYFYLEDLRGEAWLPTVCLVLYLFSYSIGIGPLPWLLMAELLPTIVKSRATAIAATLCWIAAFAVTKVFPIIPEDFRMYAGFWFFACFNLAAILFTIVFVPETKGKSPRELEIILGKKLKKTDVI